MNILNQFSYVIISMVVIVASLLLLRRAKASQQLMAMVAVVLVTFSLVGFLLLRPGSSDVDSAAAAQAIIQNGKPTMLEFFSNYCAGCLALRPAVDLLTSDIKDEFNILRIDIHTEFGRDLRTLIGFTHTPEFVLFDRNGQEVWRANTLPSREQIAMLSDNTPD